MNKTTLQKNNIFTIPSGVRFADALSAQILKETSEKPEKLANYRILLPTRRACRTLQESFLNKSNGKPLLLPTMQSIGDIEEEELSFHLAGQESARAFYELPPAIPKIKRQFLLARTIQTAQEQLKKTKIPFSQATALASALGHFMDQIHTEGLAIKDLNKIVPEEFANHWQITLDFLKILSEHWPRILEENKVIDYAQRRTILIETLCNLWEQNPPTTPIIIAGTTGSIPAVAQLMKTINHLDQGRIILPGLDLAIDESDWKNLNETHPQYGFKILLEKLEQDKNNIQLWPHEPSETIANRATLCRELMRPASSTDQWNNIHNNNDLSQTITTAIKNIQYYPCENSHEEAGIIALALREAIQDPNKTAALITPDRNLARKVALNLKKWDITIDDSAGHDLSNTPPAIFMRNVRESFYNHLSPVSFLSLMRHPFISQNPEHNYAHQINEIEIALLRGTKPKDTLDTIEAYFTNESTSPQKDDILLLINQIKPLQSFYNNKLRDSTNLKKSLKHHIELCENLLKNLNIPPQIIWQGEDGEALAKLCADLLEHGELTQPLSYDDYQETFLQLLKTTTLRPQEDLHPRLAILGQLEARLLDKDLIIIGGLNEGTWPASIAHDPWMSRPMRKDFGLPSPERSIGLAAHDFVQCLCHPQIIMTRSQSSAGALSVPARWLQRMETILGHAGISIHSLEQMPYRKWYQQSTKPKTNAPCERPAPTPPLHARPTKLSATKFETWLQDPYSIYASQILKLKPLKPLEKSADAADRGNIIHKTLEKFNKENNIIDTNSLEFLTNYSQNKLNDIQLDPAAKSFWSIRFARAFSWYIEQEKRWRERHVPCLFEAYGSTTLTTKQGEFTITAIADRIDLLKDKTVTKAAIIDYKSGGQYSAKQMENGKKPQLPIEAFILKKGGFSLPQKTKNSSLNYWILRGNKSKGEEKSLKENLEDLTHKTEENITALINKFADNTIPYHCIPNPENLPAYNDYEHLARIKEWSINEQEGGEN